MRSLLPLWGLFLTLLLASSPATATSGPLKPRTPQPRSYDTHTYYALELDPSLSLSDASALSTSLGVELVEPIGELAGHWLVRREGPSPSHDDLEKRDPYALASEDPIMKRWQALSRRGSSSSSTLRYDSGSSRRSLTPLSTRQRAKRYHIPFTPNHSKKRDDNTELLYAQNELHLQDPMLDQQWHLINTEMKDVELNVTGLWGRGITGQGVHVVIVDDGLDVNSRDLQENFFAEGSYDFNDHTELPLPRLSDDQHGTRCAGEIAAVPNDVCGVGVSYRAKIAGVRILSAPISDADEAAALNYGYQLNDIFSCSWGPPDDGKSMEAPEGLILKAMVNGVQQGRDGKGSIFVFAAGNGGGADDQCNFDGYTNSIFSVTVGAVDRKGLHPYYSEMCAAMMFVTPSSGSGDHIHTTDVGEEKCAHTHGGTSAAAPLAVGVFALALSVRPDLTWRDFQHLSVRTAVYFNDDDPDWEKTAAGRMFSYKYGYGKLDAGLFVEAAEQWKLVKPQAWFDSPAVYLPTTEGPPTGSYITEEGVTSTFEVTQDMLTEANLERLEHITVRVWIDHQRRGDVECEITSPNGVTSVLARQRRFDEANSGFPGWKFMSLKHWEENPVGTWTIKVKDQANPEKIGRFVAWSLQLWGESIDPSLAKLWAPAEEGQPDEEQTGSDPATTTSQKPKPTALLPGDHGEASGEATKPGLASTTAQSEPTETTGQGEDEDEAIAEPTSATDENADEGFFSGITTLASNSTWIAGAGMIIVLAGTGLGAFFYYRSRKRRQNLFGLSNNGEGARGAYAPLSEDVPMGLLERSRRKLGGKAGGAGAAGGTKELYDAFGDGPSDDESDVDQDENTALRYHDDFLGDDEDHEHHGGSGSGSATKGMESEYKDEPDNEDGDGDEGEAEGVDKGKRKEESGSGSSGSWQDAAEDVPSRV
ncbi:kexin [Kwoniella heveanensis BCC8398]|uniref:Kexin n=1 Tax=Kwoniella heveanensis BCC8398 TaxID=1296120 RepID=A0A1B9GJQ2_9TREE|nr:kexin [Kwoniella heveanensis BCC8398]